MHIHAYPVVGEHYHFDKPFSAAGIIKRHSGEEVVMRGMSFTEGDCVAENSDNFEFRAKIGSTMFHFIINRALCERMEFHKNQPVSSP